MDRVFLVRVPADSKSMFVEGILHRVSGLKAW